VTDYEASRTIWRKSSYSRGTGGNCVEVARKLAGVVAVRDSRHPDGPVLVFTASAWKAFTTSVKNHRLDLA
jgi:hypothetical protein